MTRPSSYVIAVSEALMLSGRKPSMTNTITNGGSTDWASTKTAANANTTGLAI